MFSNNSLDFCTKLAPTDWLNYITNTYYSSAELVKPIKVIFNAPATIVYFNDRTKVVVKCSDEDAYDKEAAIAFAIAKKLYGKKLIKTLAKNAFDQKDFEGKKESVNM